LASDLIGQLDGTSEGMCPVIFLLKQTCAVYWGKTLHAKTYFLCIFKHNISENW